MLDNITANTEPVASEGGHSYFDEHIYNGLKAFIYGDSSSPDTHNLPSFEGVIDKINSYILREDLWVRTISETLKRLLTEAGDDQGKPLFLISYLCREAVKNAVLRKFNTALGCECSDLQSLSYIISDNVAEANKVFLSLRICDPSVHSGMTMCSMLNEMISVKSQLGILVDKDGNPMYKYKFVAGDSGLVVFDKKGFSAIKLDGSTPENRHIQKALYDEKVSLIQNCLFGVDANPLNVLICKLRLWLDVVAGIDGTKAADLPHVETNIICGESLVSRFTLQDDLLVALKDINQTVADYKQLAKNLKAEKDPSNRQHITESIALVRARLVEGIGWYSRDTDELLSLRRELSGITTPGLFPLSDEETRVCNDRVSLLQAKIKKQEEQLSVYRHHHVFSQAIEWRYVFPELLDDKGAFIGFDAVVGVLPDAAVAGIGGDKAGIYKQMGYKVFKRTGNVSDMFCELANRLLVYGGCMSYIMPSYWRHNPSNYKIGEYLIAEMNPLQLILLDELPFPHTANRCMIMARKDINRHHAVSCSIEASYNPRIVDLATYIRQFAVPVFYLADKGDTHVEASASAVIASNAEYMSIKGKMTKFGLPIKNWDVNIYTGVMTGCNEAFVVNRAVRDELVNADYKNSDIIKPLLTGDIIKRYGDEMPGQWLLYIPWHFPLQFDNTINSASARAEQRFLMQYPEVYNYLLKYKDALVARNAMEVGLGFEWYALQRSGMNNNWGDFTDQKVVWKRDSSDYKFGIDYGGCTVLDDTCFMVGQHLKFLLGVFNSTMGRYMFEYLSHQSTSESQVGVFVVESMPVPVPNGKVESDIITLVNRRISENSKSEDVWRATEDKIDCLIYELYGLTENEISFIKAHVNAT